MTAPADRTSTIAMNTAVPFSALTLGRTAALLLGPLGSTTTGVMVNQPILAPGLHLSRKETIHTTVVSQENALISSILSRAKGVASMVLHIILNVPE